MRDASLSDVELSAAQSAMWKRHPALRAWGEKHMPDHDFGFWALRTDELRVLGGDTSHLIHYQPSDLGLHECGGAQA